MTNSEDATPTPRSDIGWDHDAKPAATVVLLRDGEAGLELLMLKRHEGMAFVGGFWVFPGGRIDPADFPSATPARPTDRNGDAGAGADPARDPSSLEAAARRAAVRETMEEAGLSLDPDSLMRWSHWTPPPGGPDRPGAASKRYSTAFFVAPAPMGVVTLDEREVTAHRWITPAGALAAMEAGEIGLAPPTIVTLVELSRLPHTEAVLEVSATRRIEHFRTVAAAADGRVELIWHGDTAYPERPDLPAGDVDAPGPRHRLLFLPAPMHYVRTIDPQMSWPR